MIRGQAGLTLIEAVIGNTLLVIVIFASLSVYRESMEAQQGSTRNLNIAIARNSFISLLNDPMTWPTTVDAAENTALDCLRNQNNPATAARDCRAVQNRTFGVYALDATRTYDTNNPNFGFDMNGAPCSTFQAPPATGDGTCPVGVNLKLSAQCAAADDCMNPVFLAEGTFTFNGIPSQTRVSMGLMDFAMRIGGIGCPTPNSGIKFTGGTVIPDPPTPGFGTSVAGLQLPAEAGQTSNTSPALFPCRHLLISFNFNPTNYSAYAGNQTEVCLREDADPSCRFSILHRRLADGSFTYDIAQNGTVLSQKPTWVTLTGTEQFQFEIINGLVKFCLDSQCLFFYPDKLSGPFNVLVRPAESPTSGTSVVDALAISQDNL